MAIERKRQKRIPQIVKRPTGDRFSDDAAARVISLARGILLGEKGLEGIRVKKPTRLLPVVSKKQPEKAAEALRLLRGTNEPIVKIAARIGLTEKTIGRTYLALRKRGENIPVRIRGGWKDLRRITGALSEKRIEQIMQAKKEHISLLFSFLFRPVSGFG